MSSVAARVVKRARRRYHAVSRWLFFRREFETFARLSAETKRPFQLDWRDRYPCLNDATETTSYDWHYVLHPAWAARVLAQTRPNVHVDIGSSLQFVAAISAFVPVQFYDYRPARLPISGVQTGRADLTRLPFADNSVASLSCMHVLEHIGLGRYGDSLDPWGDAKAARELARVLSPGGALLAVVPVGRPRIQFNAHRIYSYSQAREMFPGLHLREFVLIPDDVSEPEMIGGANPERVDRQRYACGCFWFVKDQES